MESIAADEIRINKVKIKHLWINIKEMKVEFENNQQKITHLANENKLIGIRLGKTLDAIQDLSEINEEFYYKP